MTKRDYITTALGGIVLALCAFAFARPTTSTNIKSAKTITAQQTTPQHELARQKAPVPEHVIYGLLLHHVYTLKHQSIENERRGKDGSSLRSAYKRKAGLSDYEALTLEKIASECEQEVAQVDARAKVVIDAFRARYPGGRVPQGEMVSPPPPELQAMQKERDDIVLSARERLRAAFGDVEFERFDTFVQKNVVPEIQPALLKIQRPIVR